MVKQVYNLCVCILASVGLMACSTSNTTPGAYPAKKNQNQIAAGAIGGTIIGGTTGAGIAAAAGSNVWVGGVIGAGVGASVGMLAGYEKQQKQREYLTQEGLRIIILGDIVEITLPSDRLFYPNEANLKYDALSLLGDTLAFINTYGDVKINVSAHSDTTGTLSHALSLSQLQAQSVMTYFWTHGKPLDQMNFYGMDHQEPIADQDTVRGEYLNRRVEIMFWKNQKG